MNLYTFGLKYPEGYTEEIDVEAPDRYIAEAMARELADRDYLPGWTLIAMPPGGSCGAVTIHTGGNK